MLFSTFSWLVNALEWNVNVGVLSHGALFIVIFLLNLSLSDSNLDWLVDLEFKLSSLNHLLSIIPGASSITRRNSHLYPRNRSTREKSSNSLGTKQNTHENWSSHNLVKNKITTWQKITKIPGAII